MTIVETYGTIRSWSRHRAIHTNGMAWQGKGANGATRGGAPAGVCPFAEEFLAMLVSFDAVYRRLKRALFRQGTMLRKCRQDSRWWTDLGDVYSADIYTNGINGRHLDVVEMAREMHLIAPNEVVAE